MTDQLPARMACLQAAICLRRHLRGEDIPSDEETERVIRMLCAVARGDDRAIERHREGGHA